MRWPAAPVRAWIGWLALVAAMLLGHAAVAQETALLRDGRSAPDAQALARVWVDAQGTATINEVSAAPGLARFQPAPGANVSYRLGPQAALWMHLRVQRSRDSRQEWLLEFPMPTLDLATLYQQAPQGWRAESAGDTLAVATWPERGRYPVFRLDVPAGETRDVFVRIRNTTAANFPMQLTSAGSHVQRAQLEYLALGTAFGALLLLIAACFALSWVYNDRSFAWYALYAGITSLAVAAYTGAAAHLLWPGFGALRDAPMPMLGAAATTAAMLFVRELGGLRRRFRRQDRFVLGLAFCGVVLTVLPPFLPKTFNFAVLGVYMATGTVTCVLLGLAAWRRGDAVGKWVFAAYLPMTVSVIATFLRLFGWVPVTTVSQYAPVAAMVVEVPLLLVALFLRSRDRHGAEIRAQALTTQDALTGLLAPHLFQDRLRQVIARYKREGASAAVMYIDLVNHARIREVFGTAVAEQSLLRSVIKLRRLVRDVDTVARVGEARFAVILEGASVRSSVTERAARLIAGGLMPLPGLKPEVTLQFHIAGLLLSERLLEAEELEAALAGQLAHMSPRTRRPIRFIVPDAPTNSEPPADSSLFMADSGRSRPPLTAVR